jgi:hypothetical protein
MIRIVDVTGDGTSNLYELCAAAYGNTIPGIIADKQSPWPDPVCYVSITGDGTLKDAVTTNTVALPFEIQDVVNSITLQNLILSSATAAVITVNSK